MDWLIRDVVVYGDDEQVRRVEFGKGVNIITGDSQTGKSALIPIIDYCLGSSEYDVPVNVIRGFAKWYGIRLETPDAQLFLARKEPGDAQNTDIMHIIVGREVDIPPMSELSGNTDRKALIDELSRRLGMMEQPLAGTVFDKYLTDPPTIRSVVPFLFQPQNVVANRDVLFYRADARHPEHYHRLQRVFPYALGAVNGSYFQALNSLEIARKELNRLEKLLAEKQALAGQGFATVRWLWDRAVALDLPSSLGVPLPEGEVNNTMPADPASIRARLDALGEAAGVSVRREPAQVSGSDRIIRLEGRSRELRGEITVLRQRLSDARELAEGARGYAGAMRLQEGRLRAVNLMPSATDGADVCPLCDQHLPKTVPSVARLRALHEQVKTELEDVDAAGPSLWALVQTLQREISAKRADLEVCEGELTEIHRAQGEAASAETLWAEQQRHLGAIQFYLETVPVTDDGLDDLQRRVKESRGKVSSLDKFVREFKIKDRLESALNVVGQTMFELSKRLNVENPEAALRLDISNLTVIRDSSSGKPERLFEIGGGENWVGYHLIASFALHAFFVHSNCPVPSFLVIDQPSQIYFPEERHPALPDDPRADNLNTDWQAVRRVYRMIFDTVADLDNRLQVIVLDHANLSERDFQSAVRARWREGRKLI